MSSNNDNIIQPLFWAVVSRMTIRFNHYVPAGVSLHTSNQDCGRKWSVQHQIVLFNVLNDEFEAGRIGLVPARLPRSHILFNVCTRGLPLLCFRSMQFLKTNISQSSVATPLIGVMRPVIVFSLQISCWVEQWNNFLIGQYLVKIYILNMSMVSCFLTHGVNVTESDS